MHGRLHFIADNLHFGIFSSPIQKKVNAWP